MVKSPPCIPVQVVDARGGPSLKITSRPKKIKSINKRARPSQISRLQRELKRSSEFCFLSSRYMSLKCLLLDHPVDVCFRLRCPQHHLQHLPGSVSKLQQPVRRRLRQRAQSRIQPLPGLLVSGPNLLEEVLAPWVNSLTNYLGFTMIDLSLFLTHMQGVFIVVHSHCSNVPFLKPPH